MLMAQWTKEHNPPRAGAVGMFSAVCKTSALTVATATRYALN